MIHLGAHMSTGKGFDRAARDARAISADAMQVFTRNPRGGKARILRENELAQLAKQLQDVGETTAYEQVMLAVSDFEKGNLRLSTVLASMQAPNA